MKSIILAVIAIASLQILACSDPAPYAVDTIPAGHLSVPFTPRVCTEAINNDNPYEFVGIYHNYGLQYFAAYCEMNGWPTTEASWKQLAVELTREFVPEVLVIVEEDGDTIGVELLHPTVDSSIAFYNTYFIPPGDSIWTNFTTLPIEVQDYLISLYDIFSDTTCTDVFEEIRQLETNLIQNGDSSFAQTRAVLLCTSAIARHSYAYQLDTLGRPYWPSETHPDGSKIYLTRGADPGKTTKQDKKNLASDVVTSDAAGAAAGAVAGGISGAAAGLLAGAATGGVGLPLVAGGFISGALKGGLEVGAATSILDLFQGGAMGRQIKKTFKEEKKKK